MRFSLQMLQQLIYSTVRAFRWAALIVVCSVVVWLLGYAFWVLGMPLGVLGCHLGALEGPGRVVAIYRGGGEAAGGWRSFEGPRPSPSIVCKRNERMCQSFLLFLAQSLW